MNIVLFSPDEVECGGEIRLPTDDVRAKHIRGVLRLDRGSWFRAGVVDERPGYAQVCSDTGPVAGDCLVLRFVPDGNDGAEVLPRVDLIIGSARPIQLKRLFRDLASIGVSRILVAGTDLSETSYFHSNIWNTAKLRQLLVEGASQGGHTFLPEVTRCTAVRDAIAAFQSIYESAEERSVARIRLERGAPPVSQTTLLRPTKRILLAIGPERGFTEREISLLDEAGFEQLGIPGGILRTETAATAAVCVVRSWAIEP